jgi:chitodextrinase
MKKLFLITILLTSFLTFGQNPDRLKNGLDTKFIALDTLTTAQRDALTLKASKGYVIFNADTNVLNIHNGTVWAEISGGGGLQSGDNISELVNDVPYLTSSSYPPHLEFNNTNKTVWNNGAGDNASSTSFGYEALKSINSNSNSNTAIGAGALSNLTSEIFSESSNNIALGNNAGLYATGSEVPLTLSKSSIFIGNTTLPGANDLENVILIGHGVQGNGNSNITVIGDDNITDTYLKGVIHGDGSGLTGISGGVTVNNTLTSTSTTEALSAAQGKVLNDNNITQDTRIGDLEASQFVQNDDINTLQLDVAALEAINKVPLTITYSASMSDAYTPLQPNRVVTMAGNGTLVITGTLTAGDTGTLEVKGTGELTLTNGDASTKIVTAPTLVWFIVNASGNIVWYTDEGGETIDIISQVGDGNTTINWETSPWQKFTFGAQNDVLIFNAPTTPKDLLTLEIKQDAVGSRTLLWGNDIYAAGGVMPTLSLGANDIDVIHFSYDGTNYKLLEDYLDFQIVASTFDGVAPTAPTNLAALTVGVTTIDLQWDAATDNVGVTGYKVYQNGILIATIGNLLTYYVEGLTEATTYSFEVSALDALGNESPLSVPLIQTTGTEAPTYGTIFSSGMNATYPAANAFDGNINTYALTTGSSGTYIAQDFGTAVTVYKIRLLPAQTTASNNCLRLNNTRIEWSNDNVTWNLFERVEPATITLANYTTWLEYLAAGFDGGAAITARYFRIINYDANSYGGTPAEIEFYTE